MDVRVHQPQYQVVVFKAIKRDTVEGSTPTSARFQATQRMIDLGPWLSDTSSLHTSKSIHEPAGGFALTVPDRPYAGADGLDSLYGVIEPMDLVLIRMRHTADGTTRPPVIMRGFVSRVKRTETVDGQGRPIRGVTISGQDYGKLWQMVQIVYDAYYKPGQEILSGYKFLERFNVPDAKSNVDFIKVAIDQLINPFLKRLLPEGLGNTDFPRQSLNGEAPTGFPLLTLDTEGVKQATVGLNNGIQTQEGTVYNLLRNYLDVGAFNELFITEDDAGVYVMYRQNPALKLTGEPIDSQATKTPYQGDLEPGAQKLRIVNIPEVDIVSMEVERSDEDVVNLVRVDAPLGLASEIYLRTAPTAPGNNSTSDITGYGNASATLFGERYLRVSTKLAGESVAKISSGLPSGEQERRQFQMVDWMTNRREFLIEQNRDNSILEHGTIVISGNEKVRAGNYVRVMRGNFASLYYVTGVSHELLPYRRMVTTLTVSRGQGFADRIRLAGGASSPYNAEMVSRHPSRSAPGLL